MRLLASSPRMQLVWAEVFRHLPRALDCGHKWSHSHPQDGRCFAIILGLSIVATSGLTLTLNLEGVLPLYWSFQLWPQLVSPPNLNSPGMIYMMGTQTTQTQAH